MSIYLIINNLLQQKGLSKRWILLIYFAIFILCYLPVLLIPFAFSDDYFFLSFSQHDRDFPLQYWAMFITAGRPIFTLFWWFYSLFVHKIADLVFLRLLGIGSLTLLALCLYKTMVAAGWRRSVAFLVPILICTIPAFQVYISWASISCTVILAAIAGTSVRIATEGYSERNKSKKCLQWLAATMILLIALAITQCNSMFYWVFVAIILFRPKDMNSDYDKRFLWYLTIFLCSCVFDFFIAEAGKVIYGTQSIAIERTHLTHHFWKKILWFVQEPLTYCLNFQQLMPSPRLAIWLAIIILIGLTFHLNRNPRKIGVALSLIPLTYVPNLAIAENWASYRTTAALSAILVLYAVFAMYGFYKAFLREKHYFVLPRVLAVLAVISCTVVFRNVFIYFAFPQAIEMRLLRSTMHSELFHKKILPLWAQLAFAPRLRYDEFGCSSMSQPAIEKHILCVLQREK